jgi:TrkA domain protein
VTAARIRVPVGSPYDGRPLSEVRARTATPIVAVVRGRDVTAAPDPGFVLRSDDTVVAVSDRHGVAALSDVLTGREAEVS